MKNHISLSVGSVLVLVALNQTHNVKALDWQTTSKAVIGTAIACVAVNVAYNAWQHFQTNSRSDLLQNETLEAEPIKAQEEESDYEKVIKLINIGIFLPE